MSKQSRSALKYCKKEEIELIENYELAKKDNFKGWCIHHRDEIKVLPSGMYVLRTKEDLIDNGRYYNCPANELIFLTLSEHQRLHMQYTSKERKLNMSLSAKKRGWPKSEATRKKYSELHKGKSQLWSSIIGKAYTGMTWKVINGKRVWLPKENV